ncbi:MAG TPA: DegV family protein [Ktedonobacterales bacterium]|nr:DegV family protein [Ktedonobacterales bacterium]
MAVQIVVDSTADIPSDRARELGIEVVPLTVMFGDQSFRDGVDLDGPTFYQKLSNSSVMPTTSTPPPALFEETYRRLVANGATGILSMHISSKLSGTFSAARQGAEMVTADTHVPIEVVDSDTVSGGVGLPAEMVAREARNGADLAALKAHAQNLFARVHIIAVLDTLEFLQRGGRIGRAQAMLGTLLSVKPLIEVRDGQVLPLEKVRTRGKALERMGQIVAGLGDLEALAVVASDSVVGDQIAAVAEGFWHGPIERFALGPVVGTHAGPGAGGMVAITRA